VRNGYTLQGGIQLPTEQDIIRRGDLVFNERTNVILYAKWTQNPTYSVTYSGNGSTGGSVPADANAYLQGDTITVKQIPEVWQKPATLCGWNTTADGAGTSYAAAATFAMGTSNVTLYAKWTTSICTVKFKQRRSAVDRSEHNLTTHRPPRLLSHANGFIFSGWYSTSTTNNSIQFLVPR